MNTTRPQESIQSTSQPFQLHLKMLQLLLKNYELFLKTAVSQVMRIRLGGKSYAPAGNCPLNPHIKGLAEFVDLMNKLQTIVEEEQNTR